IHLRKCPNRSMWARKIAVFLLAVLVRAKQRPTLHAQSASTIDFSSAADGSETVDIRNISHEVTGTQVPGRPPGERLLLRKTTHSKQVLGDIGLDATVTLEAWRLGEDPRQKPLYTLTVAGEDARTIDNALLAVSRGLEETEWWSVYKLGSGQHLFDTYVPLLSFSISRETVTTHCHDPVRGTGGATQRYRRYAPEAAERRSRADLCLGRPADSRSARDLRRSQAGAASAVIRGHHASRLVNGRCAEAILQPELPVTPQHGGAAYTCASRRSRPDAHTTAAAHARDALF